MKRVPALLAEPPGLAQWRAEHPEDDRASGSDAKAVWERFHGSGSPYHELLRELTARQQGLCAYCEQRLTKASGEFVHADYQVEHVQAKSGGARRTLDHANLVLCCQGGTYRHHPDPSRHRRPVDRNLSCGQRKGNDELDPTCDPRSFPWQERLVDIGLDGRMIARPDACERSGISPDVLQQTIDERLGLNCERLRLAREGIVANLVEWVNDVFNESFALSLNLPDDLAARMRTELTGGRLRPDPHGHLCPFWTTERQYLGPPAEDWIRDNPTLLGFT